MTEPQNDLAAGATNDALVGQLFEEKYEILSVLGQGGMGTVYKARHVHMDKLLAIKTLVQGAVNDDSSFKRFEQEAKAAASLSHPNTIAVTDFGRSKQGFAFLVMEFLPGRTLEDVLVEDIEPVSLKRFGRIFTQVCEGMQHAHKRGIIHRDLKPSNLMLLDIDDEIDHVKIVDFGLAKLSSTNDTQHLTKTGFVMGSPPYMSPEQCRGDELDYRSDIYSLGCVMYATLTGHVPHKGNNSMATIYKHISDTPQPIRSIAPHLRIPPALEQLIMQTLEKDPAQRPQSMSELGNGIRQAISDFEKATDVTVAMTKAMKLDTTRPISTNDKFLQSMPEANQSMGSSSATAGGVGAAKAPPGATAPSPSPPIAHGKARNYSPPSKANSSPNGKALAAIAAVLIIGAGTFFLLTKPATNAPDASAAVKAPGSTGFQPGPPAPATTPVTTPTTATTTPLEQTRSASSSPTTSSPTATSTSIASKPPIASTSSTKSLLPTATNTSEPISVPISKKTKDDSSSNKQEKKNVDKNEESAAHKLAAMKNADEYRALAKSAGSEGEIDKALSLFKKCLAEQKIAYGPKDPNLMPTIAKVLEFERRAKEPLDTRLLELALEIYSKDEQKCIHVIDEHEYPNSLYKTFGSACVEAGKETSGTVMQRYGRWACSFYREAYRTWGDRPHNQEYFKMLHMYMVSSRQIGDDETADRLEHEAALPPLNQAGRRGPLRRIFRGER